MIASEGFREGVEPDGRVRTAENARGTAAPPAAYGPPDPRAAQRGWPEGIEDPRRKSPALACILSAMPGLGQIYVGYYQRGFVHAFVVAGLISFLASSRDETLTPLGGLLLAFFWLYNIIDAGRRAAMYNHVLAGGEVFDLPKDISIPGLHGSIVGGVATMAVGAVLLAHTAYGYSLDWLADWWPAGLLLFGVYLVVKGVLERRQA